MLRLVFVAYFWTTLVSVVVFSIFQPDPSSSMGFLAAVPHLPAQLLHWVFGGKYLDIPATYAVDHLLGLLGSQTWIAAVLLVLLALVPTVTSGDDGRSESKRQGALFLLMGMICYPLCSALWSGIHISRLARVATVDALAEGESRTFALTLPLALISPAGLSPSRVMNRMETISDAEAFAGPISIADPELQAAYQSLVGAFQMQDARRLSAGNKMTSRDPEAAVVLAVAELSFLLFARQLVFQATRATGGSLSQPWRPVDGNGVPGLVVDGAGGSQVRIETNELAVPAAFHIRTTKEDVEATRRKFLLSFKDLPADGRSILENVNRPPIATLTIDDPLVRLWYTSVIQYYDVKGILTELLGTSAAAKLSPKDIYGELRIRLHNSEESYVAAIGAAKDHAGRGMYDGRTNRVEVWEDERSIRLATAKHFLQEMAREFSPETAGKNEAPNQTEAFDDMDLARALRGSLDKGGTFVFLHELTHWAIHAILTPALPDRTLPRCLDEGIAMAFDGMAWHTLPEQAKASGLEDWETIWRTGQSVTNTPLAAFELTNQDFNDISATNAAALYADCFVATKLFGLDVLKEAILRERPVAEVARLDNALSRSWTDIRLDLSQGLGGRELDRFRPRATEPLVIEGR